MTRIPLLGGFALRELWISFRLLTLLCALLATVLPVVLLPRTTTAILADPPPGPLTWYAVATAAALALAAGVAAWSLAAMRRNGIAAWLAVRAVPRASILLGWFIATGLVVLAGVAGAALLGWMSLGSGSEVFVTGAGYATTVIAIVAAGLVAVATGLLCGSALGPRPAALLAVVVVAAAGLATAGGLSGATPNPLGGLALLGRLEAEHRPVADGLVATGLALAASAGLLVAASAVIDRADL
jgi:hypothetical protein